MLHSVTLQFLWSNDRHPSRSWIYEQFPNRLSERDVTRVTCNPQSKVGCPWPRRRRRRSEVCGSFTRLFYYISLLFVFSLLRQLTFNNSAQEEGKSVPQPKISRENRQATLYVWFVCFVVCVKPVYSCIICECGFLLGVLSCGITVWASFFFPLPRRSFGTQKTCISFRNLWYVLRMF